MRSSVEFQHLRFQLTNAWRLQVLPEAGPFSFEISMLTSNLKMNATMQSSLTFKNDVMLIAPTLPIRR